MPISPVTESEVVARLVRGDKAAIIADDYNIGIATVYEIKKRQSKAIETLLSKVTQRKQRITSRILEKAHRQLEKRLDDSENYDQLRDDILEEYESSEQTDVDKTRYESKLKNLTKLSVGELVMITKESFHQSQVEQGKPTSLAYTADAKTTKEQLDQLMDAIKNNDGARLIELTNDLPQPT